MLNQGIMFSNRLDNPTSIRNAPNRRGIFEFLLPPKHSSSKSRSRLRYLDGSDLIGAPQFVHSDASSVLSVPHFVQ